MNTIIELNGQSVDLKSIKSVEFHEHPMVDKEHYDLQLNLLNGDQYIQDPSSGSYKLVSARVEIAYNTYRAAARAHSVVIRAWGRYREKEQHLNLLRQVEREVGLAS